MAQLELAPGAGNPLTLEVYKTGLWSGRKHLLTFKRYRGSISYDEQQPARSAVHRQVAAAVHDMLDAERFPELEFHSTRLPGAVQPPVAAVSPHLAEPQRVDERAAGDILRAARISAASASRPAPLRRQPRSTYSDASAMPA